ncbi:hypothetical protein CQA09_29090, partial [Klebsiella pneumoniae]
LARYSRERQIHEMSLHILKTMPADEAYWCTTERLQQLAIQNLYQLELALAPPSWPDILVSARFTKCRFIS